jgi:hypothetical protein
VWTCAGGDVDKCVEQPSVAGNLKTLHGSRIRSLLSAQGKNDAKSDQQDGRDSLWKPQEKRIHSQRLMRMVAQCFLPRGLQIVTIALIYYPIQVDR